jgi:hypothetical protein
MAEYHRRDLAAGRVSGADPQYCFLSLFLQQLARAYQNITAYVGSRSPSLPAAARRLFGLSLARVAGRPSCAVTLHLLVRPHRRWRPFFPTTTSPSTIQMPTTSHVSVRPAIRLNGSIQTEPWFCHLSGECDSRGYRPGAGCSDPTENVGRTISGSGHIMTRPRNRAARLQIQICTRLLSLLPIARLSGLTSGWWVPGTCTNQLARSPPNKSIEWSYISSQFDMCCVSSG